LSKFGNIFLSWRKGSGFPRRIVGVIKNNASEGVSFQYLKKDLLNLAIGDGFVSYTEFPELDKKYTSNVLEIFKQRLFRSERSDYKDFLDFWDISDKFKDDTLYLLAHTHGIAPTDNFEFLADFNIAKNFQMVSEISGLTTSKISSNTIELGEELIWKKNPSKEDKFQVDIFTKDEIFLGWVKKIHSKIFYEQRSRNLKIKVKAVDKNGVLKRVFIEISF
jgi:hypothetical protein